MCIVRLTLAMLGGAIAVAVAAKSHRVETQRCLCTRHVSNTLVMEFLVNSVNYVFPAIRRYILLTQVSYALDVRAIGINS